jgi:hypothetical protein
MGKQDKEFGSQVNLIQNDKSEKNNFKQNYKKGEILDFLSFFLKFDFFNNFILLAVISKINDKFHEVRIGH